MNTTDNHFREILVAIFSVAARKMEEAKSVFMWAPLAVLGGLPTWLFVDRDERASFVCYEIIVIGWWAWTLYNHSQHRALARSIYRALIDAGYVIRRRGIYGQFEIHLSGPDTDTDEDVRDLLK